MSQSKILKYNLSNTLIKKNIYYSTCLLYKLLSSLTIFETYTIQEMFYIKLLFMTDNDRLKTKNNL